MLFSYSPNSYTPKSSTSAPLTVLLILKLHNFGATKPWQPSAHMASEACTVSHCNDEVLAHVHIQIREFAPSTSYALQRRDSGPRGLL